MAPLNPEHLLEQAIKLTDTPAGRPRQADLKRAISAAYYALFHTAVAAATDEVLGPNYDKLYALVYRSVDHRRLRELCEDMIRAPLSPKYSPYFPTGPGEDIVAFAAAVKQLQEERHTADYDPLAQVSRANTLASIATAASAVRRFKAANNTEAQETFLLLLFFPPKAGRG